MPALNIAAGRGHQPAMPRIHAGTSGWVYRPWRAQLYAGAPVRRWLEIASREFSSLEINGSFYTQISQATSRTFTQLIGERPGGAARARRAG